MISQTRRFRPLNWPIALVLYTVLLLTQSAVQAASGLYSSRAFEARASLDLTTELTCENNDGDLEGVIEQMTDLGYSVTTGNFEVYVPETSALHIPFAEHTSAYLISHFDDTGTNSWPMGPRDIVLWRTCTPPEPYSFLVSYNSFLVDRLDQNVTIPLQASLTDPLRLRKLKTESNDETMENPPFDRKTNIAFTADKQSFVDLKNAYVNAGLGKTALNRQAIPGKLLDFTVAGGSVLPNDELAILMKVDKIKEYHPKARDLPPLNGLTPQYYSQSFPFYVFYMDDARFAKKFPLNLRDTQPPLSQIVLADSLRVPFSLLVARVIKHYKNQGFTLVSSKRFRTRGANVEGQSVFNAEHGKYCISNAEECQYDSYADAYWWDQESHQLSDDDIYVVVGVDHAKLGMAKGRSYLGIYRLDDDNGAVLKEIGSRSGSELAWHTVNDALTINGPLLQAVAKRSFLVQLERSDYCGSSESEPGNAFDCADTDLITETDSFIFRGRTTLNPKTGTRPDDRQLIPWRLLRFKK